jgi:hypothetical protein
MVRLIRISLVQANLRAAEFLTPKRIAERSRAFIGLELSIDARQQKGTNMFEPEPEPRKKVHNPAAEPTTYIAPNWLTTEQIGYELLSAEIADSRAGRTVADFARIDAYFAADHDETEAEYRRSLVRLLADLGPNLAELIGGPRQED